MPFSDRDPAHAGEAIRFEDVSFRYRGTPGAALDAVSLAVGRGEMLVVMGATGAGKSTLAKCLNRTVPAFQSGELRGNLWIHGQLLTTEGVADLAGTVGLVSQDFEAQLFATNVLEEVAFGMEQLGVPPDAMRERLPRALATVGLAGFEARDPTTLSGGEKQRLAIAATIALQPSILVFDEPTTDLDPLGKLEIFAVLATMRRHGYTLVVIEHEIAAAEHADRVILMNRGRIVANNTPAAILTDVDLLEQHGVRPPDLSRVVHRLGLPRVLHSFESIEATLRGAASDPAPAFLTAEAPAAGRPPAELIHVDGVEFRYESGTTALRNVSLHLAAGEFVALIGQNGSGKTTLAKHLNGLLRPTSGRVLLRGIDLRSIPLNHVARDVGYVFQNPDHQIFATTVHDEVAFGPRNLRLPEAEAAERVAAALEAVGLVDLEGEDPFLLSKGHRQRLAVASVLALQPRLLILDEPTTGLDYAEQRRMMDLIATLHARGMAILMITHSPWVVAEYAQRGVLMREGAIQFDGPLRQLFAEEELLAAARFCAPDVTRLGRRFGFTPLSVEEFAGALAVRHPAQPSLPREALGDT